MNKSNLNDFLTKTLSTYTFLLVIIFILKLVGLDYFGLEINNPIIVNLNNFVSKFYLENIWYAMTLYFNVYVVVSITCNNNSKKMKKYVMFCFPIVILFQNIKGKIGIIGFVTDVLYMLLLAIVYNKIDKQKTKKSAILNYTIITTACFLIQMFSMVVRNQELNHITNNFCITFLLNIDYFIIIFIIYKIYFMKGGRNICQMVVSSGLQKLTKLKQLLKNLPKLLQKSNKGKTKLEINTYRIYMFLYILWNILTLLIILFIATINNTVEECIFITTSFWLSKRTFGKPFHFPKMSTCFIVSNLTYYALNRITTPLGISIIVPIILGVGLSYVTSKFVKPVATKLYKGMTEDDFNNSILNVTDKDSLQYKICHMFYVERKSELEIAHNVGYSIDNIKKIKAKINKKIKELD